LAFGIRREARGRQTEKGLIGLHPTREGEKKSDIIVVA